MGSLYIAAGLEKAGFACTVWNGDYTSKPVRVSEGSSATTTADMTRKFKEYQALLNNLDRPIWQEVKSVIADEKPDVVGLAAYTTSVRSVINTAVLARQVNPECKIVCGGPHATVQPEDFFTEDSPVDYVIRGEGETAMLRLMEALRGHGDLSAVPGLVYRDADALKYNERAECYEDTSKLPMPAKHLMRHADRLPAVCFQPIFSSRGCPAKCIYCSSHHTFGRKPRAVPVDTVVREIEYLKKNFNVHHFFICDDTFGSERGHTMALLDEIIKRRLNITWGCQTRGEKLTEDLVRMMKKAGCTQVSIGVETGSPRIRKLIKKGNTNEDVERGVEILKKYRIEVATFFMFGFPTETREDIEQTVAFMKKLDPYTAHCNIATPDPGTEFMDLVQAQNLMPAHITDWSMHYHQSPDMFITDQFSAEEKLALITELQQIFDTHNKRKARLDLFKRAPLYFRIIWKQKLYKHPAYLLGKLRDLT
jgi:radical SAM superfamily enzyme YgiQ (UPF0313 family)